VCLFKKKDPPKKKYSKKAKTSVKANNVNGIAHVNYDGDSIDLDLLATYNAKTFHTAATGETGSYNYSLDSSSDESKNAFAALMNKPLTQKKSPKTSSPNCSQKRTVASENNNENNTEIRLMEHRTENLILAKKSKHFLLTYKTCVCDIVDYPEERTLISINEIANGDLNKCSLFWIINNIKHKVT
jgi:hypothetical protein